MTTDPNCIFCKIAAGKIPCFRVYEDANILAFLDVGPIVRGHTLVVPKTHYPTVMETPAEVLATINAKMPVLTRAVLAVCGAEGCHVLVNNGPHAMQSVHHLHYHILPRKPGDGFEVPWHAGKLDPAAAASMAAEFTTLLASQG